MLTRINKHRDEAGFTLIELLVVVIIIGILAAIAIPVFLSQRNSARNASVQQDLRTVATSLETFYTENLNYPKADDQMTQPVTSPGNVIVADIAADGTYTIVGHNIESCVQYSYDSDGGGILTTTKDLNADGETCAQTTVGVTGTGISTT